MKKKKIIYVACILFMAGIPTIASAQQNKTEKDGFINAKEYLLQKRYIPTGRNIDKNAKGKNLSIGIFGGLSKFQGSASGLPFMKDFGLSVTKDYNSFNSYRLSLLGAMNDFQSRVGLEIDHIFKIQDYLTGWDEKRNFTIETVWGLGMYSAFPKEGEMKIAGGIHGGLIFNRRLTDNLTMFVEPKIGLYTDGIDAKEGHRRYDIGFQALAGLKYSLTGYNYVGLRNKDVMDNFFYEIYAGTNGDFSNRTWSYHKMKTLGPNGGVALGKWFYPIGFKLTGFAGWRYVPNDVRNDVSEEPYAGLRLEGMINLNTLFASYEDEPKFELNLLGGYEIGALAHKGTKAYSKKIRMFHGPTAALQALYFVKPQLGIFAQARWSKNIYDQPMTNGTVENRIMKNMGLEIGVQYRRRYEKAEETKGKYAFEPYSFVSAQVGTNFPIHTAGVNKSVLMNELGQQFAISYGRRYSRVAAVRGTLEAARYGYKKTSGTYPLTIAADVMIDLFAATAAYNPERIVNLYPYVGVLFTHNETGDENNFGVRGGADLVFKVSDKWSVFLQGDMRMYKGQITPSARVYTSARMSFVPNLSAGLAYRF